MEILNTILNPSLYLFKISSQLNEAEKVKLLSLVVSNDIVELIEFLDRINENTNTENIDSLFLTVDINLFQDHLANSLNTISELEYHKTETNVTNLTRVVSEMLRKGIDENVDVKQLAKDVVNEVLQPTKPVKKLSRDEQIQQDAEILSRERGLKGIRKQAKR